MKSTLRASYNNNVALKHYYEGGETDRDLC